MAAGSIMGLLGVADNTVDVHHGRTAHADRGAQRPARLPPSTGGPASAAPRPLAAASAAERWHAAPPPPRLGLRRRTQRSPARSGGAPAASSASFRPRDDLDHQLAGLGRVQADLDAGRRAGRPSCPGPCPCRRETMAPAWPIFLPAGAVTPAM